MSNLTEQDIAEIKSVVHRHQRGTRTTAIFGVIAIALGVITFVVMDLMSGTRSNAALMIVVGASMLAGSRRDRLLAILAIESGMTCESSRDTRHTVGQLAAVLALSGLAIYCVWLWNMN